MGDPPISAPKGGVGGLVLPIMVAIAVALIGYLLFTGRRTDQASTTSSETVARSDSATPSSVGGTDTPLATGNRRAIDDASDAATVALERARASVARTGATTSATTLDSAFFNDPRSAALRYPGPVRVSGVVSSMVMPGRTPALAMEGRDRFNSMIVNFPDGYSDRLTPLYKGRFITVACDRVETLAGTTILQGCVLD